LKNILNDRKQVENKMNKFIVLHLNEKVVRFAAKYLTKNLQKVNGENDIFSSRQNGPQLQQLSLSAKLDLWGIYTTRRFFGRNLCRTTPRIVRHVGLCK
jgi:hypothetical protein